MMRIRCFAPIADKNAEILILGSMPGQASLAAGEYYAHPQNSFWRIVSDLLALDASASYAVRVSALKQARIALWDVLQSCVRKGSLDAQILPESQQANDFRSFFRSHRKISKVYFNGAAAENCFRKLVQPGMDGADLQYARLPSTSPAHAAMSYAQKRNAWKSLLQADISPCTSSAESG